VSAVLAIDFGTSFTVAAVSADGATSLVELHGAPRLPSMVLLTDEGGFLVGAAAENEAALRPAMLERAPKQRLGEDEVLLGGRWVRPVDMVAAVLREVREEAERRLGGGAPGEVRLTHPASWGERRRSALVAAAEQAGLGPVRLLSEPEAAALFFADRGLKGGEFVAVYDLGGGTFDCVVLQRTGGGFAPAGPPGGRDGLGGEVFDQRVFEHLGHMLDRDDPGVWERLTTSEERPWRYARADFRADVRRAKELLSRYPASSVYVRHPVDRELRLRRTEFEELISEDVDASVRIMADTLAAASLRPEELAGLYVTGGSSRIPLVTNRVRAAFGRVDTVDDPKTIVALGALRLDTMLTGKTTATHEVPAHLRAAPAPAPPPAVASPAAPAAAPAPAPEPPPPQPQPQPRPPRRSRRAGRRTLALAAAGVAGVAAVVVAVLLIGLGDGGAEPVVTRTVIATATSTTPPEDPAARSAVADLVRDFTRAVTSGNAEDTCRLATGDFRTDAGQDCRAYAASPDRYLAFEEVSFTYDGSADPPEATLVIEETDREQTSFRTRLESGSWKVLAVDQLTLPGGGA